MCVWVTYWFSCKSCSHWWKCESFSHPSSLFWVENGMGLELKPWCMMSWWFDVCVHLCASCGVLGQTTDTVANILLGLVLKAYRLVCLVVKASASRAPRFFRGRVIPVTYKLALQWLPCQVPGMIGSVLGLVGPVSVYCDWVRWKVWSTTSISVWQHVKLSEQNCPWDKLACCWDVKQQTLRPAVTLFQQPNRTMWIEAKETGNCCQTVTKRAGL